MYTYQKKGTAKIYRIHKIVVLGNLTNVENTEDKRNRVNPRVSLPRGLCEWRAEHGQRVIRKDAENML